jgi:hypothetical protein
MMSLIFKIKYNYEFKTYEIYNQFIIIMYFTCETI